MMIMRQALCATAISLVPMASARAQPATPASPPPVSGLPLVVQHNCLLRTLNACNETGHCTPLDNLKGQKLPVKMTVDLASGVIAGVDRNGWVDATRIASLAQAGDALILQGIDGAGAWQMLINLKNEAMAFSLATPDGASIGFGACMAVKGP